MKQINNEHQDQGQTFWEEFINTREAALYLGLSPRTLEKFRVYGGSPVFYRHSSKAIRYRRKDLRLWAEERLSHNTSESAGEDG